MAHKDKPLHLLKQIAIFYPKIRTELNENLDIIEWEELEGWEINAYDLEIEHNFNLKIKNPRLHPSNDTLVICTVSYFPIDAHLGKFENDVFVDNIIPTIRNWIKILKEYNEIETSPFDKMDKQYKDIYESFNENNDEQTAEPLDIKHQVIASNFLKDLIKVLENDGPENKLLVERITHIRENITTETKKSFREKIYKIFAEIHKKSLPLLKEVANEVKKHLIKKGIEFVSDRMITMWSSLIDLN